MLKLRKAGDRGHADHGWLDSWHTFSFASYYDPRNMGFRSLRVINEDRVAPGQGFPRHFHNDMEIVTYVLDGALEHKDSMGNGSVMKPGDVQRMSAGTGVEHSEYNASRVEPVHFLQIWLLPERNRLEPSYEQRHFSTDERRGRLRPIASPDGAGGSVQIHQDARVFASILGAGQEVVHRFERGRSGWLQVARGALLANGQPLAAGDGAALVDEKALTIAGAAGEEAELLLFDLA